MKQHVLKAVGVAAVAVAIVGVFVPLLPTTVFLLVAAWCFARSSPRLNAWLREHARFGPAIRQWEERGVVPVHAKLLAVAGMALSLTMMWAMGARPAAIAVAAACLAAVAAWLVSRPSR